MPDAVRRAQRPIFWFILLFALLAPALAVADPARVPQWSEQDNFDLPGFDLDRFEMARGRKDVCAEECKQNPLCRAYTFVRPGFQGKRAVCWLKSDVPKPKPSNCCISGKLDGVHAYEGTFEPATDLPGSDYKIGALATADPKLCQAACGRDENCTSFTYVSPGVQGPNALCYLKEGAPARKTGEMCCTSGIKASALVRFDFLRDVDMSGQDLTDFEVKTGGSAVCQRACANDAECKAYTYVKSTNLVPAGRCWLKSGAPAGRSAQCCDSGIKRPGRDAMAITKVGFDLTGSDYHHFTPRASRDHSSICADACGADSKCRAFSYVKPGIQGSDALCYLKGSVPNGRNDTCCASASKRAEWIGKPLPASATPATLYFSANDPKRVIAGLSFPADMPAVRLPRGFKNCSANDRVLINRAWALAHHHLWRAHQVMQHINHRTSERSGLWTYSFSDRMKTPEGFYSNWSPRGWFGSYEARRFRLSRLAIEKVFNERFRGANFEVQCRWPGTDGAHPCETLSKRDPDANHIVLGKINFCSDFLRESSYDDSWRAKQIVHEIFHWLKIPGSGYWVSDSHDFWKSCDNYEAVRALYGDDAAFLGMNRGCRDWNHNRAILTNDNYALFATMVGTRVYSQTMRSFPGEDFR